MAKQDAASRASKEGVCPTSDLLGPTDRGDRGSGLRFVSDSAVIELGGFWEEVTEVDGGPAEVVTDLHFTRGAAVHARPTAVMPLSRVESLLRGHR